MKLGIYGTGGSGAELYEMILSFPELHQKWEEIYFIDDTKATGVFRECIMMPFEILKETVASNKIEIVIALGEPKYRECLGQKVVEAGYTLATVISPKAEVSCSAQIGRGCVVKSHAIVSANACIADNVYINSYAIIGHDAIIGENCQICSFSITAGHTHVGKNSFIGASASIRDELVIGESAIISMGAVVLKDIAAYKVVMGNPAREIAENKERKVFK